MLLLLEVTFLMKQEKIKTLPNIPEDHLFAEMHWAAAWQTRTVGSLKINRMTNCGQIM